MKKRFSSLLGALPPVVLGLAFAGCGGGGGGGGGFTAAGSTPTGEVQLQVTDAPPQDLDGVSKAEIVVELVELIEASTGSVGSGSGNGNGNGQGNGNGNGQGNGQGNGNGQAAPSVTTTTAAAAGSQGLGSGAVNASGQGGVNGQGALNRNPAAGGQTAVAQQQTQTANGAGNGAGNGQGNGNNQGNGNGVAAMGSASTAAASSASSGGTGGSGSPHAHVVFDAATMGGPRTFNLLDLRGGITALMAAGQIPAGTYDQVRLVISGAELVVNGQSYSTGNGGLKVAAGMSSGVHVFLAGPDPLVVTPGQIAQGLLDFDLAKCFQPTGSNQYVFTPVIRAANLDASGSLAGMVKSDNLTPNDPSDDLPLGNAAVTLVQGQTAFTTFADPQGVYVVKGLAEGPWEVKFAGTGHTDSPVTAVTIVRQQQSTLDATLAKQ